MAAQRPRALVTGGSSGIGLELVKLFARDGYDVIVAADGDGVHEVADVVADAGVDVEPVQVDLRDPDGVERLYRAATSEGRVLDAAALNAGTGRAGPFVTGPLEEDLGIVDLNVRSTVHLAKLVLTDMAARGAGRVLITSSIVATMPGSHQSMYNASKSFVQSFATAVHDELRGSGVTVTALAPGPVDTNFFAADRDAGHRARATARQGRSASGRRAGLPRDDARGSQSGRRLAALQGDGTGELGAAGLGEGHSQQADHDSVGQAGAVSESADAVVIGAGHNGLVAAAMLADAGWDVLVLEAQPEPGGAVKSAELFPGTSATSTARSTRCRSSHRRCGRCIWRTTACVGCTPPRSWATPAPPTTTTRRSSTATSTAPQTIWSGARPATATGGGSCSTSGSTSRTRCSRPCSHRSRRSAVRRDCCAGSARAGALRLAHLLLLPAGVIAEQLFDGEAARLLLLGNAMHADVPIDAPGSGVMGYLLV